MSLRVALIGYGRMGKAIDALSEAYDCHVVDRLDIDGMCGHMSPPGLCAAELVRRQTLA